MTENRRLVQAGTCAKVNYVLELPEPKLRMQKVRDGVDRYPFQVEHAFQMLTYRMFN